MIHSHLTLDASIAPGQANGILSPHPLYLALGEDDKARREAYRDLFRTALDDAPLTDLHMALNRYHPIIGNSLFYAQIEVMAGHRRKLEKRGRPRKQNENQPLVDRISEIFLSEFFRFFY